MRCPIKLTQGNYCRLSHREKRHTEYHYRVTQEYVYESDKWKITVPKGFLSDGATIPLFGILLCTSSSWAIHDWLYAVQKDDSGKPISRKEADEIFLDILYKEKFRWWYNIINDWMYSEYIQCILTESWTESGCRGPEFYKDIC